MRKITMTQLPRILWLGVCIAAFLLLPGKALAQQQITPINGGKVTSPIVAVNNGSGDQTEPHVDNDLIVYTDSSATSTIRYFRVSTGEDLGVPAGAPGTSDFLSNVNGNRIVFSRLSPDGTTSSVFLFDTATSSLTEIDPQPGQQRFGPAIGGDTIAYPDQINGNGDIFAYDLAANPPTPAQNISMSVDQDDNPSVSPDGNTIVWERCRSANCDVLKAVRSAGIWTVTLVTSSIFNEENPHTDGTWLVYDSNRDAADQDIFFQPVAGGIERHLVLPGDQLNPHVSQGVITFESRKTGEPNADIFAYVIATNTLYQVTSTPAINDVLTDVSVLPNGDIRVVWASQESDFNVYATTFTPGGSGDFSFDAIAPLTLVAGGSASTTVTVDPTNNFGSQVNLNISGEPLGITASLLPNAVTPSGGNAASVLEVSAASFVPPMNFTLTVTGASGQLSHSATVKLTVSATATSTSNSIGDMLNAGCIDNAGIASALTSKLAAAQRAGDLQTSINALTALKNQIQAQAGKHIHTGCVIGGVSFSPVTVLLLDVQALIDSLRVSLIPDPVTGYVVDGSGIGLAGATVSILNSAGGIVASVTTDISGFYFLATTGVLTPGAAYTIAVTGLPAGFGAVTPPNQTFTWQGSAVAVGNFVVN